MNNINNLSNILSGPELNTKLLSITDSGITLKNNDVKYIIKQLGPNKMENSFGKDLLNTSSVKEEDYAVIVVVY